MDVYELLLAHPKLAGYQIGHDYWMFAAQDLKPSYWLILQREGFSGDIFGASDKLDRLLWNCPTRNNWQQWRACR